MVRTYKTYDEDYKKNIVKSSTYYGIDKKNKQTHYTNF